MNQDEKIAEARVALLKMAAQARRPLIGEKPQKLGRQVSRLLRLNRSEQSWGLVQSAMRNTPRLRSPNYWVRVTGMQATREEQIASLEEVLAPGYGQVTQVTQVVHGDIAAERRMLAHEYALHCLSIVCKAGKLLHLLAKSDWSDASAWEIDQHMQSAYRSLKKALDAYALVMVSASLARLPAIPCLSIECEAHRLVDIAQAEWIVVCRRDKRLPSAYVGVRMDESLARTQPCEAGESFVTLSRKGGMVKLSVRNLDGDAPVTVLLSPFGEAVVFEVLRRLGNPSDLQAPTLNIYRGLVKFGGFPPEK